MLGVPSYLQCTYSLKLLKYKLIYWLFILKMAIFSPERPKKWHFWEINVFILLVDICSHACGLPSYLGYTNSIKLVLNPICHGPLGPDRFICIYP